jgi:hypothetical protein
VAADVIVLREVADATRREQPALHHAAVVGADVGTARALVHPRLGAARFDRVVAQRHRIDAVVHRRLVQAHEGIAVVPVPAGRGAAVDHHDLGVALGDQRVGERHAGGAAADDEIVGFQGASGHAPLLPLSDRTTPSGPARTRP